MQPTRNQATVGDHSRQFRQSLRRMRERLFDKQVAALTRRLKRLGDMQRTRRRNHHHLRLPVQSGVQRGKAGKLSARDALPVQSLTAAFLRFHDSQFLHAQRLQVQEMTPAD